MNGVPTFDRYIGIDYSGAQTPTASLRGLRVYMADRMAPPFEVQPPTSQRKYWTRAGIAAWLSHQLLKDDAVTLVGIDHGFSFPLAYFREHQLPLDWMVFLIDFQRHWPIGRQTKTYTLILFETESVAMPLPGREAHGGGASQR